MQPLLGSRGTRTRHKESSSVRLHRGSQRDPTADAGPSSIVPITLRSWPGRMPSQATRGREPQVVVFDMDVLAERYRESLWGTELMTSARPGLLAAAARLRERFLLCVLCRSPVPEAIELVRALYDKGLGFDYEYALPPSSGRAHATPVLDVEAMRLLREEIGMTVARWRRMLAVISLELEDAEIEARLPRPMQMPAWLGGAARHGTARQRHGSCNTRPRRRAAPLRLCLVLSRRQTQSGSRCCQRASRGRMCAAVAA